MKKFKDIRKLAFLETHDFANGGAIGVGHGRYQVDKTDSETLSNIQQAINHELNNGSFSLPLKKATEVFGRGMDIDKFDVDFNNQSAISTGLTLNVSVSQDEDSLYRLNGKIK